MLTLIAALGVAGDGYFYVRLSGGEIVPEQDQGYKYVSLAGGELVIETAEAAAAARRVIVVGP